jgi:hypothetical protein
MVVAVSLYLNGVKLNSAAPHWVERSPKPPDPEGVVQTLPPENGFLQIDSYHYGTALGYKDGISIHFTQGDAMQSVADPGILSVTPSA